MTMSTLMCPHCGGRLLIDPTLRLQSMLTCPYCARKSLMQKKNGMIVLRGIIASSAPNAEAVANTTNVEPITDTDIESVTAMGDVEPVVEPVEILEPALKTDESPEVVQPVEPEPQPIVKQPVEPEPLPAVEQSVESEPQSVVEPVTGRSLDPIAGPESVPVAEDHTVPSSEPEPVPVDATQSIAAETEPLPEEALKTMDPVVMSGEPAMSPVKQEIPAVSPDEPSQESARPIEVAPALVEKTSSSEEPKSRQEHLIALANRAADEGSIMAFNSYARQAIDCDPTDPRMYALRSRLIEQAHGFARATFLSPVWMSYTPRQKAFVIAQHFSSFNAAVHYSLEPDKAVLADETGRLIAWQIREAIIENARLRLGKRPFNGRFHRQDLGTAPRIIDSVRSVNETVVPQVADELLRSIRSELDKLDPKLYYQLLRIGF